MSKPANGCKSFMLWLEGTLLCEAHDHPDLDSDRNALNQLGPNEGHFARSFISYMREKAGLSGPSAQLKSTMHHDNNGGSLQNM